VQAVCGINLVATTTRPNPTRPNGRLRIRHCDGPPILAIDLDKYKSVADPLKRVWSCRATGRVG
jgi:hypothetical protein